MPLQLVEQLVNGLSGYRPKILQLQKQLVDDKLRLDDYIATYKRLGLVSVHPALKDSLLPELPPSEATGTLADLANVEELFSTHELLAADHAQMSVRQHEYSPLGS